MEDIETTIYTTDDVRISVDEWDEGGVWLGLQARGFHMHATLTRKEAVQMLKNLQAVLAKEVAA